MQRVAGHDSVERGGRKSYLATAGVDKLDVGGAFFQRRGPVPGNCVVGDVDTDDAGIRLMVGDRESDGSIAGGEIQIGAPG